ncbi:uncharacterized protein JCM15063_002971 [Sporobolomyces koalae]|uniref:uncharacterized protein n=1 Tax=Sporobolomyces koalae TaxID=500713 RepID=UPI0031811219
MTLLSTLRVAAQLTLTCLSLVLFGVTCGALVSDDFQGNPAIAVLAFISGLSTLMIPGIVFLSYAKPGHWVQTTFFHLGTECFLFVFLTTGLAELTYNQSTKLSHCMNPPTTSSTLHNFGLVCTLLQTMLAVGWTCWSLLSTISLTTLLLAVRRFWIRDSGVLKTPVQELWSSGWNGSWEKHRSDTFA